MYVVVAYDANEIEQQRLRRVLSQQLNRIQNSVFAGSLHRIEADHLCSELKSLADAARVHVWIFTREPEMRFIGAQLDQESGFI